MRKRAGRPPRYAAIPNETIDDAAHLDLTALGLLAVLLRHRDGWEITLADIGARYGYGEDALARAMGLLQVARYVVKIRIMSTEGNRWSTEVVVYDTPATDEEIAALLDEIAHEPGVRQVQLIPPTKTAIAHAEKRRNRLSPDSGKTRSRGDLRKHGKTPGRPDSGVFRDPGNPGVIKKTVLKKTKNSSPYPLADVQEPHAHRPQEEEGIPQTDRHGGPQRAHAVEITVDDQHTPSDLPMCQSDTPTSAARSRTSAATGDHGEAAAALVADLPTIAARAGRALTRALRADETTRITALVAAALARGWTADQIRAVLADDLRTARSPVATWHARLASLGAPPAPAAAAAPPKCGQCNPYRWLEDSEGLPLGRCPTCHPGLAGRGAHRD